MRGRYLPDDRGFPAGSDSKISAAYKAEYFAKRKRGEYEIKRKVPADPKRSRRLRHCSGRPDRFLGNRGIWREPSGHHRVPYAAVGHHRLYRYVGFFYYNGSLDSKKGIQRF